MSGQKPQQQTFADQLYGMGLMDRLESATHFITRVPGGWMFTEKVLVMAEQQALVQGVGATRERVVKSVETSSVFVPYNPEFVPPIPQVH